MRSNQPILWARFGPAHIFGPDPAHFKEKNQKYLFQHFIIFPRRFYVILINIGQYFYVVKYKSGINIPDFRQKPSKNTKKKTIKKKTFLCIRPSVSKLKIHIVFFIHQKKCFSMHFGFNNQFIKVKRILAKISKTTKNFICLLVSGV